MRRFVATASFFATSVGLASGHGYVESPRSRSYRSHVEGVTCRGKSCNYDAGTPQTENCHYCLNRKDAAGVCGYSKTQGYENGGGDGAFLDVHGNPMPWNDETELTAGGTSTFVTVLTAHHRGHMELKACPMCPSGSDPANPCFDDGVIPDQDCFDNYPLTFVGDLENTYGQAGDPGFLGALPDDTHPERAMYSPDLSSNSNEDPRYAFEYELPAGMPAGRALLQYTYVTANSCNSEGYPEYFAMAQSVDDGYAEWWSDSLSDCTETSPTGHWRQCDCGERFWNCVEVSVVQP